MAISHRQRLERTLSGEKPDRVPIAFWHHFPIDDQTPETLSRATLAFQNQFDFDLGKIMPPSSFCLKDWGVKDEWRGNPEGTRTYTKRAIISPEDWRKLTALDPEKGFLGQQLTCIELIQDHMPDDTPYIQTIFSPLSQAKNLVGPENLLIHLRRFPDALHKGLKTICESTLRFIYSAKLYGIAGIFYAIQHASYQFLTKKEYLEFGLAYDLKILEAVNDLWLNMAHIHGKNIMYDIIADYPLHVLNWHDRETPPSLVDGLMQFNGCACGGIGRMDPLVLGTPEEVRAETRQAIEQTNGKRLIIGTGCVLPLTTPYGNILAARKMVEEYY